VYLVISGKYDPTIIGAFSNEKTAEAAVDFYLSIRCKYLSPPVKIVHIEVDQVYPDSMGAESYMLRTERYLVDLTEGFFEKGG
jgi:hypothetical protein